MFSFSLIGKVVVRTAAEYLAKEGEGKLSTKLFLSATPRQLRDRHRKWIQKEYDTFLEILKKTGIQV